ncbi:hypothetical protein B7486_74405 [cyanobacterium TDX16]|nr:hypothetical protein B7486_74405 [cyanobacterium TDX16]
MAPSVATGIDATGIDIVIPGQQVVAVAEAPQAEQATGAAPEVPPGWGQPDPSAHPASGTPLPAPAAEVAPTAAPAAPAVPAADAAPTGHEASTAKSFEAQWEQEAGAADPDADRAFAQFFSDKVEQDPSQTWLQEAEAS